ncbi:hypothetical protein MG293_020826, partial [Ovis ammon polii]
DSLQSRFFRMSGQDPPQLLDLANQSLLWNEALAIVALEDLPIELFPTLFMVAFARRHLQVLNVVMQSRPFPCLRLGTLMKEHQPHLETFQAPLDDLDVLLAQGVQPRWWKMQLLNLEWKAHQDIWTMCSSKTDSVWSLLEPEPAQSMQKRCRVEAQLKDPMGKNWFRNLIGARFGYYGLD